MAWMRVARFAAALTLGVGAAAGAGWAGAAKMDSGRPIVIAHRGASAERPEHTLAAYERAIERGADFIEPDLVSTKDGVLVARHENEIGGTTDVATRPEFADRRTTKRIDGREVTGWFTEDFTLAELKTLRARERLPMVRPANVAFDGRYAVPTLEDIIQLARRKEAETGRSIGLYIETKHPSYFQNIGLPLEPELLRVLTAHGYEGPQAPVFLQSFEVANLKALRAQTRLPLVQLMEANGAPYDRVLAGETVRYADMATPEGLALIATYADAIGIQKEMLVPRTPENDIAEPTTLVRDAHAAGLGVHVWTFRSENLFLPRRWQVSAGAGGGTTVLPAGRGQAEAELELFLELGVDGVFADDPAVAVPVRDRLLQTKMQSAAKK
ncbi:glycerophosphodiester phosphodiesterase [Pedomonas sp.]|uniref:glycerophosphodiester phosphodiesterase n=1 Tax=Pedomonas sp. TaxID=2976421 RepID=UPI0039C9B229